MACQAAYELAWKQRISPRTIEDVVLTFSNHQETFPASFKDLGLSNHQVLLHQHSCLFTFFQLSVARFTALGKLKISTQNLSWKSNSSII